MKNILLAMMLVASANVFAGTDKCGEETKTKVHFKLTHDRSKDVVTQTGKNMQLSVEVNNTSAVAVRATINFYSDGKLVQSFTTAADLAAGAKTTVANKVGLAKGKKIDNIDVIIKNANCNDVKKNLTKLQASDNAEIKTALNEIGF